MHKRRVLVIDSSRSNLESLARELRDESMLDVVIAASLDEAGQSEFCPDAVAFCLRVNDTSAQIRRARKRFGNSKILVGGYVPAILAFEAGRAGADALLPGAITSKSLRAVLCGRSSGAPQQLMLMSLARAEWEYLHAALAACQGNRTKAARQLGVHRSVLQRKLSRTPPAR